MKVRIRNSIRNSISLLKIDFYMQTFGKKGEAWGELCRYNPCIDYDLIRHEQNITINTEYFQELPFVRQLDSDKM